jgi:putative tryptophan/tyrosine transport system substrate-binding protein
MSMRRRALIAGLGSAAAWPLAARAQKSDPVRRGGAIAMADIKIGILHSGTSGNHDHSITALTNSINLAVTGGTNFIILNTRYAGLDPTKLATFAKELVGKVDVLVAAGGTASAQAALAAANEAGNRTIKIVFTSVTDPVGRGLVQNLAAPEGIITGIWAFTSELDPNRLALLCQLPGVSKVGVLTNTSRPGYAVQKAALDAQTPVGVTLYRQDVPTVANKTRKQFDTAINTAFGVFASGAAGPPPIPKCDAVLVTADPAFTDHRVAALASKLQIPAIYQWRTFADEGGLLSYGPNLKLAYTMAGIYVGRLVSGTHTINQLPVYQMKSYELILNLTTASAFSFALPDVLLQQVTEVIV